MNDLRIATWNISCGIPAEWSILNGIKKEKDYKRNSNRLYISRK